MPRTQPVDPQFPLDWSAPRIEWPDPTAAAAPPRIARPPEGTEPGPFAAGACAADPPQVQAACRASLLAQLRAWDRLPKRAIFVASRTPLGYLAVAKLVQYVPVRYSAADADAG